VSARVIARSPAWALALAGGCVLSVPDAASTGTEAAPDSGSADTGGEDGVPGIIPGDTNPEPDDTAEDTGGGGGSNTEIYEAFYDISVVQEIEVELEQEAIDELNRGGREEYVPGNAVINGERFENVGVRFKGSSTYETFEYCGWHSAPCKPAFKIRLDKFVEDQKLGNIERITLNNMTYDPTQAREAIDYRIMRLGGRMVPLVNYAHLVVNGDDFGLYVNLESMDDRFLKRRYDDPTGDLWGTDDGNAEFSADSISNGGWVLKSGVGDKDLLRNVAQALRDYQGNFAEELGPYVDYDDWLDYLAWNVAVGNEDGYPWHANDMFLYADPSDGNRFDFYPWGMDEAWYYYMSFASYPLKLGAACNADSACQAELFDRIEMALTAYEEMDVGSLAVEAFEVSQDYIESDPRRPYALSDVNYYRSDLKTTIDAWPDFVRTSIGLPTAR
jgi:hypothetical protein